MSDTSLPKPLSAYVGLLVASVEEARSAGSSPVGQLARLPIATVGQLLTARSHYDELAATGDLVVDVVVGMARQRFGGAPGEASEWISDKAEVVPEAALEPEPELTPMQRIEQFSVPQEIGAQAGGLKTSAQLPLDDFDHMAGPQLRGRLRTLDRVQLVQLLDYERAHADRVGIVLMLENRLAKLLAQGDMMI